MGRLEILLFLLFQGLEAELLCPLAQDIAPCACKTFPNVAVRCDGVSNLASVRAALGGHFEKPLPNLQLTNVHSFSLPPYALGDLLPRKLYLMHSNIRIIDDEAFEGQDDLGLLVMAEDRLEEIPTEPLRRLTGLQTLSLRGNFLMKVRKESLSGLDSVRFLVLSDNRISEIEREAFPRNLESLALSRNLLSTLNGSLEKLEQLEQLLARDNRLTGIRGEFEDLHSLKSLHLDRNYISDISEGLGGLTSLTALTLSGNRIQKVGSGLSGLKRLKILNVSYNYITELSGKLFEKLRELEILDLSGNFLKSVCTSLKPLRELRELSLSDIHLRRLEPNCFENMKKLKSLDLSRNHLTTALFEHPLPSLANLCLEYNKLTTLTYGLRMAKNLKELDIRNNRFSVIKAQQLANNRELATFKIGGNPWKCTHLLLAALEDLRQNGIDIQGSPSC